jgi:hypothetical protein
VVVVVIAVVVVVVVVVVVISPALVGEGGVTGTSDGSVGRSVASVARELDSGVVSELELALNNFKRSTQAVDKVKVQSSKIANTNTMMCFFIIYPPIRDSAARLKSICSIGSCRQRFLRLDVFHQTSYFEQTSLCRLRSDC